MIEITSDVRKILKNTRPTSETILQYASNTLSLIDPEFTLNIPADLGDKKFAVKAQDIIRECKNLRMADTLSININGKKASIVSKGKKEKIFELPTEKSVSVPSLTESATSEGKLLDGFVLKTFEGMNNFTKEMPLVPSMQYVNFDGKSFQCSNLVARYTWVPEKPEIWGEPFSFIPEPLKMIKGLFKGWIRMRAEKDVICFFNDDLRFYLNKHKSTGKNVEIDFDDKDSCDIDFLLDSANLKKVISDEANKLPSMTERRWLVPAVFQDHKLKIGQTVVADTSLPGTFTIAAECLQSLIDGNYVWFKGTTELIECEVSNQESLFLEQFIRS